MDKNIKDILPLTKMQELMLIYSISNSESFASVETLIYLIDGELNLDVFKTAWERVIKSQTILRTSFVWDNLPQPFQVIRHDVEVDIEFRDWTGKDEDMVIKSIEEENYTNQSKLIDLTKSPLLNLKLIKLSSNKHYFVFGFHHIILDGWSVGLVMEEFKKNYKLLSESRELPIPFEYSYKNYVEWLNNQEMNDSLSFWEQHLEGITSPSSLKEFIQKDSKDNKKQVEISTYIPINTTRKLELLAKSNRVTLNTIFQAAWTILISKYREEEDVVFGFTVSGRPPGIDHVEHIAGVFINNIPIRIKLHQEQSLKSLLSDIQFENLEVQEHQHIGLSQIHNLVNLEKGSNLFDHLLIFQNYPHDSYLEQEDNSIVMRKKSSKGPSINSNYHLTVACSLRDNNIFLRIVYNEVNFDPEEVNGILENLKIIFEQMIDDERNINEFNLVHEPKIILNERKKFNHTFKEPSSPMEIQLSEIWKEVLGLDEVGVNQNLFELGGHSITIMQIIQRVKDDFEIKLSISDLFENPSIESLALLILNKYVLTTV